MIQGKEQGLMQGKARGLMNSSIVSLTHRDVLVCIVPGVLSMNSDVLSMNSLCEKTAS